MGLSTILLIVLILLLIGAVPAWPYSTGWGYYPSGIVGVLLIVVSALVYVAFILPWILHRVSVRAKSAAMDNAHNWDVLWRAGGLIITFTGNELSKCMSPSGNWRDFVTQYLPRSEETPETQGIGEESNLEKQSHRLPNSLDT